MKQRTTARTSSGSRMKATATPSRPPVTDSMPTGSRAYVAPA